MYACLPAWLLGARLGLRVDFVQIDFIVQSDDFTVSIVTAGWADMMRALQLAAIGAFIGVVGHERVMRAAIVPARAGDFILLDSHVSTFGRSGARSGPVNVGANVLHQGSTDFDQSFGRV